MYNVHVLYMSQWPIKLSHKTIFTTKSACPIAQKLSVQNFFFNGRVSSPSTSKIVYPGWGEYGGQLLDHFKKTDSDTQYLYLYFRHRQSLHHITNCRQNIYTEPVHNRTLKKSQRSERRDPLCRLIVESKLRSDGAVLSADPLDLHPAG